MIVVPESMIVENPLVVVFFPTTALAPLACQNPFEVDTLWYSIDPVYSWLLVPPKNSSDPDDASLKPNTPDEIVPADFRLLNHGVCRETGCVSAPRCRELRERERKWEWEWKREWERKWEWERKREREWKRKRERE